MIIIIIGLIVLLVIGVVVINGMQQHKKKQQQEQRAQSAKYKAILDDSEELIQKLTTLPSSPTLINILLKRAVNAATSMSKISPDSKPIKQRLQELESQLKTSTEKLSTQSSDDNIVLPDDEQQLVAMLQTIKKMRTVLKSESAKNELSPKIASQQDLRLDSMQLKIGIESIISRAEKACAKGVWGSARQYFEKALQTLKSHPNQSEYTRVKKEEIEDKLDEITKKMATTNAQDVAKKAKDEEDDLDMLFQPKKKW